MLTGAIWGWFLVFATMAGLILSLLVVVLRLREEVAAERRRAAARDSFAPLDHPFLTAPKGNPPEFQRVREPVGRADGEGA